MGKNVCKKKKKSPKINNTQISIRPFGNRKTKKMRMIFRAKDWV